ncbi:hypothetical protein M1N05_02705 [Dehalococcoidales bacterium]|nr:hypothetical protein [Dehalococcoidales bacterium]
MSLLYFPTFDKHQYWHASVKPRHDGDQPKRGGGHRGNSCRRPEVISEFIDIFLTITVVISQ